MITRISAFLCTMLLTVSLSATDKPAGETSSDNLPKGLNGLYMGHSFFWPSVWQLKSIVGETRIEGHKQALVRAGGRGGAPGSLWNSKTKRKEAQKVLDAGNVDLLVMTYFSPADSSVETYSRWIDYARQKNPEITVMVAIPWGTYLHRASDASLKRSRSTGQLIYETLVVKLRQKYPDNKIIYCPYGLATYELIDRLKAKELPGVKHVLNPDKRSRTQSKRNKDQLLNDELGHAGELVTTVATMIWLKTLYDYDLSKLKTKSVSGLSKIDCTEIATKCCQEIEKYNEVYQPKK